jgi:hypothetical protein
MSSNRTPDQALLRKPDQALLRKMGQIGIAAPALPSPCQRFQIHAALLNNSSLENSTP